MEPMKSKIKGVFTQGNKEDSSVGRGNMNIAEEWEIRPGGMLVQKRTTADSNHNSVPVSTIKCSKSLQQITLDVDQLGEKVTSLETTTSKGGKIAEKDVDELTAMLMEKLVAFDGIFVEGDLKLQKRMQERRVQQYVETLDKLKLSYSTANSNGGKNPIAATR
ncbi:BAG FAMILY MOLECULAR CHAPERONE REGULATOR-LIKE PROTEIN [Salix viminalis]|uniref:BAG FAMILY MOLECULAR CHAPERONE REGULATOR-LIKE PROTEIN n=1 Tax=Salix viminalis TaxID=40686 RepID=A0A9Q0YYF1_SALVM|nr:BAG FAMILY MOLECULAR CHAPERONE REGULATOR-LIKE PROTEIN [Salix viminalis]